MMRLSTGQVERQQAARGPKKKIVAAVVCASWLSLVGDATSFALSPPWSRYCVPTSFGFHATRDTGKPRSVGKVPFRDEQNYRIPSVPAASTSRWRLRAMDSDGQDSADNDDDDAEGEEDNNDEYDDVGRNDERKFYNVGERTTTVTAMEQVNELRDEVRRYVILDILFATNDKEARIRDEDYTLEAIRNRGGGPRNLISLGLAGMGLFFNEYYYDPGESKNDQPQQDPAPSNVYDLLPTEDDFPRLPCLYLALQEDCDEVREAWRKGVAGVGDEEEVELDRCIPVPIFSEVSNDKANSFSASFPQAVLKLLAYAYRGRPISRTLCLTLTQALVNRDDGLFDNLPWAEWTIDPDLNLRDAAGNPVLPEYTFGKRDAFNRLLGKDWPGYSLYWKNLKTRIDLMLNGTDYWAVLEGASSSSDAGSSSSEDIRLPFELDDDPERDATSSSSSSSTPATEEEMAFILSRRVLELELREARSQSAEAEREVAVARSQYKAWQQEKERGKRSNEKEGAALEQELRQALQTLSMCDMRLVDTEDALAVLNEELAKLDGGSSKNSDMESSSWASALKTEEDSSSPSKMQSLFQSVKSTVDRVRRGAQQLNSSDGRGSRQKEKKSRQPPYRGATGYEPKVDSPEELFGLRSAYRSPYDHLLDIIREQLRADVIGVVLEDASLFEDAPVLGGAIVLQRDRGITTSTVRIEGRDYQIRQDPNENSENDQDKDDGWGNENIRRGELFIVECYVDEAIAMALTADLPVMIHRDVWGDDQLPGKVLLPRRTVDAKEEEEMKRKRWRLESTMGGLFDAGVLEHVPKVQVEFDDYARAVERLQDLYSASSDEDDDLDDDDDDEDDDDFEDNFVRDLMDFGAPKTTSSFFDFFSAFRQEMKEKERAARERKLDPFRSYDRPRSLFPTGNPVRTLDQYDELTIQDKAALLQSLPSFQGKLPRPRVLREAERDRLREADEANAANNILPPSAFDPLDNMLIPLIDESVRRRLLTRDAERRGDSSEAQRLSQNKSRRQQLQEEAEEALQEGRGLEAEALDEEARLLEALRADVTQDEGAYSRFLDQDEWYERERRKTAERVKKQLRRQFGNSKEMEQNQDDDEDDEGVL